MLHLCLSSVPNHGATSNHPTLKTLLKRILLFVQPHSENNTITSTHSLHINRLSLLRSATKQAIQCSYANIFEWHLINDAANTNGLTPLRSANKGKSSDAIATFGEHRQTRKTQITTNYYSSIWTSGAIYPGAWNVYRSFPGQEKPRFGELRPSLRNSALRLL